VGIDVRDRTDALLRAKALELAGADHKARFARALAADHDVRHAVADTWNRASKLRRALQDSDVRDGLGRMARDERLQAQLLGLLRSATEVLDSSRAVGKRTARLKIARTLVAAAVLTAGSYVAVREYRRRSTKTIQQNVAPTTWQPTGTTASTAGTPTGEPASLDTEASEGAASGAPEGPPSGVTGRQ
jgi:hypothetical protein